MRLKGGIQWITALKKRWVIFSFGKAVLLSAAFALIGAAITFHFLQLGVSVFLCAFMLIFLFLSLRMKYWKISETDMARFIDLHFPEVEESSSLLLKPIHTLSFLEQLQVQKVNDVLVLQKQPSAPLKQLKMPLVWLAGGIAFSLMLAGLPFNGFSSLENIAIAQATPKVTEQIPAAISSFTVQISPPSYTGKPSRSQHQFSVLAENGARVSWQIKTSQSLKKLGFIFNDSQLLPLKKENAAGTIWSLTKEMIKSGFYQIVIEGKRSDFYQVEIIPDQPVSIKISKPLQHSTIDIGQPQQVNLNVFMEDDYGMDDAYISATMASGKGEAVSFKEKKLSFNLSFKAKKRVKINKLISLSEMGMKPGDELYFYISAKDNHGQVSRSDMYFVSIQDTTELMSMAGIDNGVNLVPEYFRSERQIIIDTEKLLKERPSISEAEFKTRSNDLGVDQKMLRLRYGKFLGEESEASIGGEHEEGDGHDHKEEPAAAGDVQAIMDQYAHKHDNAEDANFFEPQLKAQLKSTLAEMWNAELRLRTYKPEEALPYEYKALRLLKDLQQKSRAYVAKSTFKTSTLKPEKRLTGELTAIKTGINKSSFEAADNSRSVLKQAIGVLEDIKDDQPRAPRDINLLLQAQRALIEGASVSPGNYLPALKAIKKIIASGLSGKVQKADIALAEKGMNNLLGQHEATPYPQSNSSSSALTRAYFNQLKRLMP